MVTTDKDNTQKSRQFLRLDPEVWVVFISVSMQVGLLSDVFYCFKVKKTGIFRKDVIPCRPDC